MSDMVFIKGREDSPVTLLAHVQGADGLDITQDGVQSLSYQVWQYDTREECENDIEQTAIGTEVSLTVASTIYDELQTGGGWEADDEGYNLRFVLPADKLPVGGKWYRVEVWIVDGDDLEYLAALYGIEARPTAKS